MFFLLAKDECVVTPVNDGLRRQSVRLLPFLSPRVFFDSIQLIVSAGFRYRDEDGEPLMDYDDIQSDRDRSPEPNQHLLDDLDEDDGWRGGRERSQTPVHDADASASKSKPRKRLIKKSHAARDEVPAPDFVDDVEDGDVEAFVRDDSEAKRKKLGGSGSGKKEKKHKGEKKLGSGKIGSSSRLSSSSSSKRGFSDKAARDQDGEVKEMWDTIAGGDSEVNLDFGF